jgi:hypothetical protein
MSKLLRAYTYRGRHRTRRNVVGHAAMGIALFYAVYLH